MSQIPSNEILVPRINISPTGGGNVIPLPTGIGQARTNIQSIDVSRPNPVFDPSANQQTGITFNVGGVSYRKGQ